MNWRILAPLVLLVGCSNGDRPNYPSREQVIAAAAGCGIEKFQPTKVDAGIAAYVAKTEGEARQKEDCIYDSLHTQGFIVTR